MTTQEIRSILNDKMHLSDIILVLINPEATVKSWDIPLTSHEEGIEAAYNYFIDPDNGWNPEFINNVFNR